MRIEEVLGEECGGLELDGERLTIRLDRAVGLDPTVCWLRINGPVERSTGSLVEEACYGRQKRQRRRKHPEAQGREVRGAVLPPGRHTALDHG